MGRGTGKGLQLVKDTSCLFYVVFISLVPTFDACLNLAFQSLASRVRKQLNASRTKGDAVEGFNYSTTTMLTKYLEVLLHSLLINYYFSFLNTWSNQTLICLKFQGFNLISFLSGKINSFFRQNHTSSQNMIAIKSFFLISYMTWRKHWGVLYALPKTLNKSVFVFVGMNKCKILTLDGQLFVGCW